MVGCINIIFKLILLPSCHIALLLHNLSKQFERYFLLIYGEKTTIRYIILSRLLLSIFSFILFKKKKYLNNICTTVAICETQLEF